MLKCDITPAGMFTMIAKRKKVVDTKDILSQRCHCGYALCHINSE